jgi:exopolysaccharide biosynthesis polyprenyl glycosylphosphotransferase
MLARYNRFAAGLFLAADATLAFGAFGVAIYVRTRILSPTALYPVSNYAWIVPLAAGLWVAVGLLIGVYREIQAENLRRALWDPLRVAVIATTLLFAVTFAFKLEYISRLLLGLFALADFAAVAGFRLLARLASPGLRRRFAGPRHVLIVGRTPEAAEIARLIESDARQSLALVGFAEIPPREDRPPASPLLASYPVYALDRLRDILHKQVIDEVVFAVSKDQLDSLQEAFLICEEEGVKTRLVLSFFPHLISKVHLERMGEWPLLTFSTTPLNEDLLLLKRVLDFMMALVLLVVLSPLFLVLALAIKLTSRGPIFHRQTRSGLGGRKFRLYKFRSMRADAERERRELEPLNEMDGPVFKIRNDPRLTPLGRFMRRFSLDELPQLANILQGEMSFVGPRPPLPEEVERYAPWQRRRLRMQPGLTCLWALAGRNQLSFERWMELDLEYIDNWSPALDWKILLKTIPVVLLGRGAS